MPGLSEIEIVRWNLPCEVTTVAINNNENEGEYQKVVSVHLFRKSRAKRYTQRVR